MERISHMGGVRAVAPMLLFGERSTTAQSPVVQEASVAELRSAHLGGATTNRKVVAADPARIEAYDRRGPRIRSVNTDDPQGLAEAQAMDSGRTAGRVRGPLHGVTVVLQDSNDTFDLPTTGRSQLLGSSIPPDDAFIIKRPRAFPATSSPPETVSKPHPP
jgi:amidase